MRVAFPGKLAGSRAAARTDGQGPAGGVDRLHPLQHAGGPLGHIDQGGGLHPAQLDVDAQQQADVVEDAARIHRQVVAVAVVQGALDDGLVDGADLQIDVVGRVHLHHQEVLARPD